MVLHNSYIIVKCEIITLCYNFVMLFLICVDWAENLFNQILISSLEAQQYELHESLFYQIL